MYGQRYTLTQSAAKTGDRRNVFFGRPALGGFAHVARSVIPGQHPAANSQQRAVQQRPSRWLLLFWMGLQLSDAVAVAGNLEVEAPVLIDARLPSIFAFVVLLGV